MFRILALTVLIGLGSTSLAIASHDAESDRTGKNTAVTGNLQTTAQKSEPTQTRPLPRGKVITLADIAAEAQWRRDTYRTMVALAH